MHQDTIAIFTSQPAHKTIQHGGTMSWKLNKDRAAACRYFVLVRNAHGWDVGGGEAHRTAFLVGRISGISPAPTISDRWTIECSHVAAIDIPNSWEGSHNPIRYTTLLNMGIDEAELDLVPIESARQSLDDRANPPPPTTALDAADLTIAEAKRRLAASFGVSPEAIEITIRG